MRQPWVQRAVIAVAAAVVFLTSVPVPFIYWDDPIYVTGNLKMQTPGLKGLAEVWDSSAAWRGETIEFFPLRDTAYWVTWQLFGRMPAAFHVLSILVHGLVALLVMQLALRFGAPSEIAFWAALLFAVHPVHVESVTWVAGLKDPMCTAFILGAVLAWLRYLKDPRPVHYALSLGLMLGGLLTKSLALVTPLLFLAADRLASVGAAASWRQSLLRVAVPVSLSALFFVEFVAIGKANGVLNPPHGGSWGQHWFLMAWALVRYVQQAFVPATFRIHYCFPPLRELFDARLLGIFALLVGLVLLTRWAFRDRRVALGVAWFLACLAPVANLIPFPAIMADRYLYAPSIASCLGISWALSAMSARLKTPVRVAVVVLFALVTAARGVFWQTEANLWAEAVEDDACLQDSLPQAAVMYFKHAESIEVAEPMAALEAYRKGLSHQAFVTLDASSRANYLTGGAFVAVQVGDSALADEWRAQALSLRPDALTLWDIGMMRLQGRQPQGVEQLALAARLEPARFCPLVKKLLGSAAIVAALDVRELERVCAAK